LWYLLVLSSYLQVASTLRVRPLTGQPLQPAFSSLATAQLEVKGCPASSSFASTAATTAAAGAAAAAVKVTLANIKASTFYSTSWRVSARSNVTAGKLVVQQGKAVAVEVTAALSKSSKRTEFAAVSGVVVVEGLSSVATALRSVQVSLGVELSAGTCCCVCSNNWRQLARQNMGSKAMVTAGQVLGSLHASVSVLISSVPCSVWSCHTLL
jgi:hypothetical protein